MRRTALLLIGVTVALGTAPARAADRRKSAPAAAPLPDARPDAGGDGDLLYQRDLRAYRGLLRKEELDTLAEEDPATALWMGPRAPGEGAVSRLFAALPDAVHSALQQDRYVKWRLESLPPEQRKWVLDAARALNSRGEGPFPVDEKALKGSEATVGFVRVEVLVGTPPLYSFFIRCRAARRPAYVTLVRAFGLLTLAYQEAHSDAIDQALRQPDSPPVAAKAWVNPRTLARPAPPPPVKRETAMAESTYWAVVRAYRAGNTGAASDDPVVQRRLASTDPRDEAINAFFARLSDRDHRALLDAGRLHWGVEQLSREQRKVLEPLIAELNRAPRATVEEPYSLLPYGGTELGLTVVHVPGVETPCLSVWIASRVNPTPTWFTLSNAEALRSPHYYRAHLEQLRGP